MSDRETVAASVRTARHTQAVRVIGAATIAALAALVIATALGAGADPLVARVIFNLIGALAGALCLLRALRVSYQRSAWVLFGAAVLTWTVGDLLWGELVAGVDSPVYPSWADAFYIAFYPLALAGIVSLADVRRISRSSADQRPVRP